MEGIEGQTALITGASSGIGKACAEQFAKQGVHLVLAARRVEKLTPLAELLTTKYNIKATPIHLDVQKHDEVQAVFNAVKDPIDILVNNAGLGLTLDKIQDAQVNNWDTMIDTNIKGLLYVTRATLPSMIKRNKGHIINIGSVAGRDCYPGGNIYCATKHAVKAITQSLRLDLLGTNIRVTEIAPGAVETEFSQVRLGDEKRAKQVYQGFTPLVAEDIADAVIYCATRKSHVNVSELVIYPQAQASVNHIHRNV